MAKTNLRLRHHSWKTRIPMQTCTLSNRMASRLNQQSTETRHHNCFTSRKWLRLTMTQVDLAWDMLTHTFKTNCNSIECLLMRLTSNAPSPPTWDLTLDHRDSQHSEIQFQTWPMWGLMMFHNLIIRHSHTPLTRISLKRFLSTDRSWIFTQCSLRAKSTIKSPTRAWVFRQSPSFST